MYRFLLRPRWIVFHVVCVLGVVVMVNLGFWQLSRLDQRRAFNELLLTRASAAPDALDTLRARYEDRTDDLDWRRASATGTYDPAGTVLIRDRSLDGRPGWHVVTPLRLADGSALIVLRGWVPVGADRGRPDTVAPPPEGTVEVVGVLQPSERRRALAGADPATGVLTEAGAVDLNRLQAQSAVPLAPVYLVLGQQTPPVGAGDPRIVPLPERTDGPHLSYAVQWFVFSACVPIGWVIVVRKSHRDRVRAAARAARDAAAEGTGPTHDVPAGVG
jgi:surfeit locus 1 family protein